MQPELLQYWDLTLGKFSKNQSRHRLNTHQNRSSSKLWPFPFCILGDNISISKYMRNSILFQLVVQRGVAPNLCPHGCLKLFLVPLQNVGNAAPLIYHLWNNPQNSFTCWVNEKKWHRSSKKPAKTSDWFTFHSRMVRTKITQAGQ